MAADFKVDNIYSKIAFKISRMGFSTMLGHFNQFEGNDLIDGDNPAAATPT
ncbi:YceI family protein [Zobellella maritima]|uniref:hypothetical protein n=1 Tax=Zobellella maritima TaxID=2059725 RepID=UPI0013001897|nr:hypothetical protein [Zobellella maritima]